MRLNVEDSISCYSQATSAFPLRTFFCLLVGFTLVPIPAVTNAADPTFRSGTHVASITEHYVEFAAVDICVEPPALNQEAEQQQQFLVDTDEHERAYKRTMDEWAQRMEREWKAEQEKRENEQRKAFP